MFNYDLLNWYKYFNMVKEVLPWTAEILVPSKKKRMTYLN